MNGGSDFQSVLAWSRQAAARARRTGRAAQGRPHCDRAHSARASREERAHGRPSRCRRDRADAPDAGRCRRCGHPHDTHRGARAALVAALLAPQLGQALLWLSLNDQAKALGQRTLRALAGFTKALKVQVTRHRVGLDFAPEAGPADKIEVDALEQIVVRTQGYPYFLFRRRRRATGAQGHVARADPQPAHLEGDDLEPRPWRHRVRGAAVRFIHAPDHAGRRLAGMT